MFKSRKAATASRRPHVERLFCVNPCGAEPNIISVQDRPNPARQASSSGILPETRRNEDTDAAILVSFGCVELADDYWPLTVGGPWATRGAGELQAFAHNFFKP
jgi:hypothetical protein